MDKAEITQVLQLNIRMWSCANRFGLTKLKELALARFFSKERYFDKIHLEKILATVYEETSQDDTELRYRFFFRCVENYSIVETIPRAVDLLEAHDFASWRLAKEYSKKMADHSLTSFRLSLYETAMEKAIEEREQAKGDLNECKLRFPPLQSKITNQANEIKNLHKQLANSRSEVAKSDERFAQALVDINWTLANGYYCSKCLGQRYVVGSQSRLSGRSSSDKRLIVSCLCGAPCLVGNRS